MILESVGAEMMFAVGPSRLRAAILGQGRPAVVIEAGLGDGLDRWKDVQAEIASFTRVLAYDRAGVGKSAPGPKPRTSRQMVAELRLLLRQAQIAGPYVLAGHSLGGLNAQLFAQEYPDEVAGLVLVDPTVAEIKSIAERVLGKFWIRLWNSQFASGAEGMTSQDAAASCAQVAAAGRLPDIPLVVISAGKPIKIPLLNAIFPGEKLVRALQESHAALAKQSSLGRHLIAEASTHLTVSHDALVVASIRQVVQEARAQKLKI